MRPSSTSLLALALLPASLAVGCTRRAGVQHRGMGAPGLTSDAPLRERAGTNPNAPYTEKAEPPRLLKRAQILGSSAAEPCTAESLDSSEISARMSGNFRVLELAFVNRGRAACTLGGYPSITLLDTAGNVVGGLEVTKVSYNAMEARLTSGPAAAAAELAPTPAVLLAPGDAANFEIGWTSGEGCPQIGSLVVAAPRTLRNFTIAHPISVCSGGVEISPLRGGDI